MVLVYSRDDGGWYWERRNADWSTSQVFRTRQAAVDAQRQNKLRWKK